jgi:hypothetical protein
MFQNDQIKNIKWAGHAAYTVEMRNVCKIMEDTGVDKRIILKWILGKQSEAVWTGFIWVMTGTGGGLLLTL